MTLPLIICPDPRLILFEGRELSFQVRHLFGLSWLFFFLHLVHLVFLALLLQLLYEPLVLLLPLRPFVIKLVVLVASAR